MRAVCYVNCELFYIRGGGTNETSSLDCKKRKKLRNFLRFLKLADEKQKIVFNFIQEESHKHSDTKRFVFGDLALNSLKLYMKK